MSFLNTIAIFKSVASTEALTPLNLGGVIFYLTCSSIFVLLFKISQKWKFIMVHWSQIEMSFLNDCYTLPKESWSLRKRIGAFAFIYLAAAFIEHLFSISTHIQQLVYESNYCNITVDDYMEYFITSHLDHYVQTIPFEYNNFLGILFEYFNISLTFYWSFINLFIILISIGIAFRFEQINYRIKFFKYRIVHENFWSEIRFHHMKLSELLHLLNENINEIIIVACFSDAYFILIQIVHITAPLPFLIDSIYFWYSFTFLMFRVSSTFLFASTIYEQSRKPLEIVRTIPNEGWCQELERFFIQLKYQENILSAMGFFFITKKLLLSFAAALITYELVLVRGKFELTHAFVVDCSLS